MKDNRNLHGGQQTWHWYGVKPLQKNTWEDELKMVTCSPVTQSLHPPRKIPKTNGHRYAKRLIQECASITTLKVTLTETTEISTKSRWINGRVSAQGNGRQQRKQINYCYTLQHGWSHMCKRTQNMNCMMSFTASSKTVGLRPDAKLQQQYPLGRSWAKGSGGSKFSKAKLDLHILSLDLGADSMGSLP